LNEKMVRFIQSVLQVFSVLIPVRENRVAFLRRSFSGSNITPLIDWMRANHPEIDILLLDSSPSGHLIGTGNLSSRIRQYLGLLQSKVIVTTHGPFIKTAKNKTVELWHAFPTKKPSTLHNQRALRRIKRINRLTDHFVSYSDFSSLLHNSRNHMDFGKYVPLGAPRNDYLFSSMPDLYHKSYKKVILYAPTFRESFDNTKPLRLNFWFDDFSAEEFHNFLVQNECLLIWKLHPNDEKRWSVADQSEFPSNLLILTDNKLREMGVDLYQLLSLSDALITDFSSIYADYLLLDRPMIFTAADELRFNEERGLLLNPYDAWMPGPKCRNFAQLKEEILRSLSDPAYFQLERHFLRRIFHRYTDGGSTERVGNFILTLLRSK